jgi:acyl dehydratase
LTRSVTGSTVPASRRRAGAPGRGGHVVGTRTIELDRAALVRYAGASGDFNPIHWNEAFATEVGLPGVIAHGMLTMGSVVGVVADWAGDPGAVVSYQTRFTKPVPVPVYGAAAVEVSAAVAAIDPEAGTVRVDLTVTHDGVKVLGRAQAVVRL